MSANSRTPLMEACWEGNNELVKRMIAEGAELNAQNANGTTPLMYAKTNAFSTGNTDLLRLLLNHGADPSIKDKYGKTAADYTNERCRQILDILNEYVYQK